jgi:thioredoxin 1
MLSLLMNLLVGAGVGAFLGYWGRCSSGGCPLMANWRRGALYGAAIGAMLHLTSLEGREGSAPSPSTNVNQVTEATFDGEVLHATLPVVADFYASWCGPCKALAPTFDQLGQDYAGRVKFVRINVDDAAELAKRLRVEALPTLLFFQGGKTTRSSVGLVSKRELTAMIDALLQPARGQGPSSR